MNQEELIKPFIKSTIMDIYTSDRDYIDFHSTDEFTNHEKFIYLAKKTYKQIKLDAVKSRINACVEENDIKGLAYYTQELAHTVIALEQSIYEVAHIPNNNDTDDLFNGIVDLYGGIMEYESVEVFETIKKIIEEMKLF